MHRAGLSLLFAAGKRPSANDIDRLLSSSDMDGAAAHISHRPDAGEGWVELLATGLTFDLIGLSPADPAPMPSVDHRFGVSQDLQVSELEAITLVPGPHISSQIAMMPVVRAMAGLAASIALPLAVEGVCWHAAQSWMGPQYFSRAILNWLSGGAFPALGLTAIEELDDASVASVGLAHFTGQEIQLEPRDGEAPADTVKLAVRLIDYMVRNGRIDAPRELEGPDGERLLAEPTQSRQQVWVWRDT